MRGHVREGSAVLALFLAFPASADPGDHIPVGDATFTPGLGLGMEYSTNARHVETVDGDAGATNFAVAPVFDLRLSRDDLEVGTKGAYTLRKYIGKDDLTLDQYDAFLLQANVDAYKQQPFGIRANESLGMENHPVDGDAATPAFTKQFRNQVSAEIPMRPRAAFDASIGGRYYFDDYQTAAADPDGGIGHYNTRNMYGPIASVEWRFLPRTMVAVDFSYDHASYVTPVFDAVEGVPARYFPDRDMVRVLGGLRGLVTDRLTVTLMAGYGMADFDEDSIDGIDPAAAVDPSGMEHLLVDTSLRYSLSDDDGIVVGFQRDFRDSFFTNYVAFMKGHVSADARLTDRVGLLGEISLASEQFRGQETRDDSVFVSRGEATYFFRDWASITAGVAYQQRWSSNAAVTYSEILGRLMMNATY